MKANKTTADAGIPPEKLMIGSETYETQADKPQLEASVQAVMYTSQGDKVLQKERDLVIREVELLKRELELLQLILRMESKPVQVSPRKW